YPLYPLLPFNTPPTTSIYTLSLHDALPILQAITEAMQGELERDDNVFVLGEDVGNKGGVFRATDGLYDTYGEDRVIDSPLAESGDRKSTRLNSSHVSISYAVFCLKKKSRLS